jgi:hypothetical protein
VETFLKCPTKCFFRSCGEVGAGNAYAAWVRTKNNVFRLEGTKRLVAGVASDKCAIGTQAMASLKPAQWRLGIDFAVQSQNLQCSCHAVERLPSPSRGRTAQFVPIRFVFRNKLNRDDKLLLAFATHKNHQEEDCSQPRRIWNTSSFAFIWLLEA